MSENYFFKPQLNSSGDPVCYTPNESNELFKDDVTNELYDVNKFRRIMNNTNYFKKKNFTINLLNSPNVNECKNLAQQNNSNFFLVGDFSTNLTDASYNCYILQPDVITNNNYNKVIEHLISPINNFINLFFGSTIDVGTNNNCIRISSETDNSLNNIFATNDTFVLYKADFINNPSLFSDLNKLKSPIEFINKKNDYEQNYETSVSTYIEQIRQAIQNWCDNRDQQIIQTIYPSVQNFVSYINDMNDHSRELSDNLAKLSEILNSYIVYLDNFEENLEKKKNILKNLKSSGNGNNGRLEDNFTLIRTKYIEISILVIIIITTLIFSLKKK